MSGKRPVGYPFFTLLVLGIRRRDFQYRTRGRLSYTPNSLAPQGTRWYYHVDRTNQRKRWYVRATSQPAQQAEPPRPHPKPRPLHDRIDCNCRQDECLRRQQQALRCSISSWYSAPRLPHVRIPVVSRRSPAAVSAYNGASLFREAGRKEVPGRQFRSPRLRKQAHCGLTLTGWAAARHCGGWPRSHAPVGQPSLARSWPMLHEFRRS